MSDVEPVEPLLGMPRRRASDGRIEIDGSQPGGVEVRYWSSAGYWHVETITADGDGLDGEPCRSKEELRALVVRLIEDRAARPHVLAIRPLTPADPIAEALAKAAEEAVRACVYANSFQATAAAAVALDAARQAGADHWATQR